ncbi:MAG: hypothetical protein AB7Y46_18775, partial [Armatimonadota bacterium]
MTTNGCPRPLVGLSLAVVAAMCFLPNGCETEEGPAGVGGTDGLRDRLAERMAALQEVYPATEQDVTRYDAAIRGLGSHGGQDRSEPEIAAAELPGALPTVAGFLASDDARLQVGALRLVSEALLRPDAATLGPTVEPTLLMLLLARGDDDRDVRLGVGVLTGQLLQHAEGSGQPPLGAEFREAALTALRELASSDPDETVRDV